MAVRNKRRRSGMGLEETLLDSQVPETSGQEELDALIQKAQTNPEAMMRLGSKYLNGEDVEKDPEEALKWFEKSGTSSAMYGAAVLFMEQKDFKKQEAYLLRGLEVPDSSNGYVHSYICGSLGELYLTGFYETETPDYEKAVYYFERKIKLDPAEGDCIPQLAQAYRKMGKNFQAIHWYKKGLSEFGIAECEEELWKLYLTGAGGEELKKQAEERIAPKAQEPGYPASFTEKMEKLLNIGAQLRCNSEEAKVPKRQRGLFSNNTKEVEKIEADNAKIRQNKADYEQLRRELSQERNKLEVYRKFFFDIPLVTYRNKYRYLNGYFKIKNNEHSLYTGYLKYSGESYRYNARNIDKRLWHISRTYVDDELNFYMCDELGKLVDKNYEGVGKTFLYLGTHNKERVYPLNALRTLMESDLYIRLFYDRKYMEEYPDEEYSVKYLWDYEFNEGYIPRNYEMPNEHDMMQQYAQYCPTLSALNYNPYGGFEPFYLDNDYKSCGGSPDDESGVFEKWFMKKAAVIWSRKKVRAILLPKESSPIVRLKVSNMQMGEKPLQNGDDEVQSPQNGRKNRQVIGIEFEEGTNIIFQNMTSIMSLPMCLKDALPPFDATMEQSQDLPDEMWRLWMQLYYEQDVENQKNKNT
jgi:hypothetical protein